MSAGQGLKFGYAILNHPSNPPTHTNTWARPAFVGGVGGSRDPGTTSLAWPDSQQSSAASRGVVHDGSLSGVS